MCDIVCVRVWRVNLLLTGTVSWDLCVTMATTGDKDQGERDKTEERRGEYQDEGCMVSLHRFPLPASVQ